MGRGGRIEWKEDRGKEERRIKNLEGRKQESWSKGRYLHSRCKTIVSEYWAVEWQIIHGVCPGFPALWLNQGDTTHNKQVSRRKWTQRTVRVWRLYSSFGDLAPDGGAWPSGR